MVELPVIRPQKRRRFRKKFRYVYKIFVKLRRPFVRRDENQYPEVLTHEVMTTGGDHLPYLPSLGDVVAFLDDLDLDMVQQWQPDELKIARTISKRLRYRDFEIYELYRSYD